MATSSKWLLSFRFPHQNSVGSCLVPHTCHVPHQSHPSWCNSQNVGWLHSVMHIIVQFPPALLPHPLLGWNSFLSTKFHTHTNQQAKLQFSFINVGSIYKNEIYMFSTIFAELHFYSISCYTQCTAWGCTNFIWNTSYLVLYWIRHTINYPTITKSSFCILGCL
jgi:hypothetical protein